MKWTTLGQKIEVLQEVNHIPIIKSNYIIIDGSTTLTPGTLTPETITPVIVAGG